MAISQSAFATLCSKEKTGGPCTPDPGKKTDDAKDNIIALIKRAQSAETTVKRLEAEYRAARDNPDTSKEQDERRYLACEAYRVKKLAQDQLYKDALDQTEALYHVRPRRTNLTIAKPDDPVLHYTEGLPAAWNPKVTDSGPNVVLLVRILGSDNQYHYDGIMMDPSLESAKQALTFQDGRTVILKDSFDIAVKNNNPGFLANLLYHESRHFNQLDRPAIDDPKKRRGWASEEEDELSAYRAALRMARAFGLTKAQREGLQTSIDTYDMEVAHGRLTRLSDSPTAQENLRGLYAAQINLEEEFAGLKKRVEDARARQLAEADRQRAERERLAREEKERQAQEQENIRQGRRTAELYARQELLNELARCWYQPIYRNRADQTVIAFRDEDARHNYRDDGAARDFLGLKILLLITRACDLVEADIQPENIKACNDAAPSLRDPMSYDLRQQISEANSGRNMECVDDILANAPRILDSASFNKVVAEHQKRHLKKKAVDRKRDRKERERDERDRERRDERPPAHTPPPAGGRCEEYGNVRCPH